MHQAEYWERDKGKIPKAVKKKSVWFVSFCSVQQRIHNGFRRCSPKGFKVQKKNIISRLWRIYPDNIFPQARRGERAALSMVMKRGWFWSMGRRVSAGRESKGSRDLPAASPYRPFIGSWPSPPPMSDDMGDIASSVILHDQWQTVITTHCSHIQKGTGKLPLACSQHRF